MAEALRRLGFNVEEDEASRRIKVEGRGGEIPATEAELFVGLAGTAARFMTALCASAKRGTFKIDGVPQMRKAADEGPHQRAPVDGRGHPLPQGGGISSRSRSARTASAAARSRSTPGRAARCFRRILMVAPLAGESIVATPVGGVRKPFVRMTTLQMAQFGVGGSEPVDIGNSIKVDAGRLPFAGRVRRGAGRDRGELLRGAAASSPGGSIRTRRPQGGGQEPAGRHQVPGRPGPVRGGHLGHGRRDHGFLRARSASARASTATSRSSRTPSSRWPRSPRSLRARPRSAASPTPASRRRTASPGWRGSSGASARRSSSGGLARDPAPAPAQGRHRRNPRRPPLRHELRRSSAATTCGATGARGSASGTRPAARRPFPGSSTCWTALRAQSAQT